MATQSLSHLILHRTSKEEQRRGVPVITKGEGIHVYDSDGRCYVDMNAGVTRPVHLGYGNREVAQAVYDQIMQLSYFTPSQFATKPAIDLAGALASLVPGDINHFVFECDGSEAVESAMKIAKQYHAYTGKPEAFKVISRRGAYHGVNGVGIRALGVVMPMRQVMEPVAPGAVFVESPYCYRCPFGLRYPDCDIKCARDVERIIEFEGPRQITAFIAEPIQQGFGAYSPPPEYFPIIEKLCSDYGILLIIDEVICGFGRTGKYFGHEHFDVHPDIITMAKGITSGYIPLGAVGCTDDIADNLDVFMHLHTYGNHPVPCAAGLQTLEVMKKEHLVEQSADTGAYFLEGLQTLEHHPIVGETRGRGLWTAIDFTSDRATHAPMPQKHLTNLVSRAMEKGYIFKAMGQALEFAPPLIIEKTDIDTVVDILDEIIGEESRSMGLS